MIPKEASNTGGAPIPHSGQSGRGVQLGTAVRFALKGPRPGGGVKIGEWDAWAHWPLFQLALPHWFFLFSHPMTPFL